MRTITIKTVVSATKEISVPYYGRSSDAVICITGKSEYNTLQGITISKLIPSIRTLVFESDFFASKPCTPAEFAVAFEEAHHNLRAKYEAIIAAQEGGKS
jgi:hypothetical protein